MDPRWPADFITADQEEFLDVFWRSRSCVAFLDEGGESVGRYAESMQKTATRGRHWGHACHFIAQRATQLAPIVRDQCTHLFLFCSSAKDGKLLSEEWNKPELERCSSFSQGEYIHAVKFGQSNRRGGTSNDPDSNGSGRRPDGSRGDSQSGQEEGDGGRADGDGHTADNDTGDGAADDSTGGATS